eukprot:350621-Chlamydomonas_euryale.AAC.5
MVMSSATLRHAGRKRGGGAGEGEGGGMQLQHTPPWHAATEHHGLRGTRGSARRAHLRQRRVVVRARGDRVQRQIELVIPAELKARTAERIVPLLSVRVALGKVGGVRRNPARIAGGRRRWRAW